MGLSFRAARMERKLCVPVKWCSTTSLTGYQEVFTDPSYTGQIVVLTNPQVGNYGTNEGDNEAASPYIEGLVVREWAEVPSNWRSGETADRFLERHSVPVISEMDTRALVRKLRIGGVLRGALSPPAIPPKSWWRSRARALPWPAWKLATRVSTKERYEWNRPVERCSPSELLKHAEPGTFHVVAYDFGIKRNILRCLSSIGARVHCRARLDLCGRCPGAPARRRPSSPTVPGDPEPLEHQAEQVRKMIGPHADLRHLPGPPDHRSGLSAARPSSLKFGHRGINHPVLNTRTNKVEITVQNHGLLRRSGFHQRQRSGLVSHQPE